MAPPMSKTRWLAILLLCGVLPLLSLPGASAWDDRLTSAVRYGDLDLARHLLEDGFAIDVNDCNSKRETPLDMVCDQNFYYWFEKEGPLIRELICRRNLETLPLKIDEQGNTRLEGWGPPCNGLVARGYLEADGHHDEQSLDVCWEVLNISEETTTFVYAHAGMPLVLVTDENGEELERTREQKRIVYSFENRNYRGWASPFRPFYPGQTDGFCMNLQSLYNFGQPGTYTVTIQYKNLYERREPDLVKAIPFEIEVGE